MSYFSAQYPKRFHESSRCGPFEPEQPKRYQMSVFLTPKRYEDHPCPLFMGVASWGMNTQGSIFQELSWYFSVTYVDKSAHEYCTCVLNPLSFLLSRF